MAKKSKHIWNEDGGKRCTNRPQPVRVAKKWNVSPDVLPSKKEAPRRRKLAPVKPNLRAAVAVPMPGQSYNPADGDHQAVLAKAVRKLEKKKAEDAKFVTMMNLGRNLKIKGNFSADKTWDEEVALAPKPNTRAKKLPEVLKKEATEQKKKERKKKKLGKKGSEREARQAMHHRRHPKRGLVEKEAEELDKLLVKHGKRQEKLEAARQKRRATRKENLQVKHFGRYYHTPLVVDVLSSDKLVGSLRHMSGGTVHPVLDRLKSLEERNLVPARMRHTYNKAKILKPKGELRLKKETFGVLPETSF